MRQPNAITKINTYNLGWAEMLLISRALATYADTHSTEEVFSKNEILDIQDLFAQSNDGLSITITHRHKE